MTDAPAPTDSRVLLGVFEVALLARRFEERIAVLAGAGELPATLHPGAGQEVAQIAALAALRPDDPMLYGHRGTAYWLARGVPLDAVLCDIAGREGGTNRGRGGVMHVVDRDRGVLGESGALGASFTVAAGVAFADRALDRDSVTVCFFGDGAANRGQFHEAANFAGVHRLPVIWFCENNGWGLSVPAGRSTAVTDIAERAAGYGFPGVVVDGTDAEAVHAATAAAAARARSGQGPTLIEAKVPRIGPHYLADRERYRPADERAAAAGRDPLPRLEATLRERGLLEGDLGPLERRVEAAIDEAVDAMRRRPMVDAATLRAPPPGPPAGDTTTHARSPGGAGSDEASGEASDDKVAHAIRRALDEALHDDLRVVVLGEDVGPNGGVWGVTRGLHDTHGDRVLDTPLSEHLIVGAAIGMALRGMRPVAELQYADFVFCAGDEVFLTAATWAFSHDLPDGLPLVLRVACGGGGFGPEHSQSTEAYLAHTPGLVVAAPSTAADAHALVHAALAASQPVVLFEHKLLYGSTGLRFPGPPVALGEARIRRRGRDVTVVAWHDMLRRALAAAEAVAAEGIEVEVVDPVTLAPLDRETLVESVSRTGACIVVEEAPVTGGMGAEIGALLMEQAFGWLDRPLVRLGIPDLPVPMAEHLAAALLPTVDDIADAVRRLCGSP